MGLRRDNGEDPYSVMDTSFNGAFFSFFFSLTDLMCVHVFLGDRLLLHFEKSWKKKNITTGREKEKSKGRKKVEMNLVSGSMGPRGRRRLCRSCTGSNDCFFFLSQEPLEKADLALFR